MARRMHMLTVVWSYYAIIAGSVYVFFIKLKVSNKMKALNVAKSYVDHTVLKIDLKRV